MKRLYITLEEKARLESLHALKENGKERGRLKAILLRSEGWTVPMISQALLLQAGYHRSQVVVDKAKEMNISLHFLPPYSPNLNPIERLWKVMNEKIRNNRFFKSAKDFKEAIKEFFCSILPNIGHTLDG